MWVPGTLLNIISIRILCFIYVLGSKFNEFPPESENLVSNIIFCRSGSDLGTWTDGKGMIGWTGDGKSKSPYVVRILLILLLLFSYLLLNDKLSQTA